MNQILRRSVNHAVAAAALALAAQITPAAAHPHVWVTTQTEIVYDASGQATAIRHAWTFDELYSAFLAQGLDTNGDGKFSREELAELARINAESLAEVGYFSTVKANGKPVRYAKPVDHWLDHDGKKLTLNFTLPFDLPAKADRLFSLEIYDPAFFVSFAFADGDGAVRVTGAPAGCKLDLKRPVTEELTAATRLSESFFSGLSAQNFGARFANRALVACP